MQLNQFLDRASILPRSGGELCNHSVYSGPAKENSMRSLINDTPAARPDAVLRHFGDKLTFETDCWEVHESLKAPAPDFVVIDVRGPGEFAQAHVPGAINIPYLQITASEIAQCPRKTTFVVYGAGSHCNRADKAAIRLAELQLPVKIMVGGLSGWVEEAFPVDAAIGTPR
jgi:rhodanese-related sulfurtransferase